MNAQQYTSLADQVARQQPELAAYDAEIALRQPTVNVLQAAVAAAQTDVDTFTAQRQAAEAIEDEQARADALAAIDTALQPAQDALRAAQDALGGPASELDALKGRADAIRSSIAQCQAAMAASGLTLDAAALQTQRLADARALMWERIKVKRESLSDNGGYTAGGKWFESDAKSKTQQIVLSMMGANVPAVQWKTMDGTFVTMTQALAGAIFQAAAAQDMAIFSAAEQHRAAMQAAADPLVYDFSGGWPAVFGG